MKIRNIVAASLIALSLAACTDEKAAEKALVSLGMTHIRLTGYDWFGCGKDDQFSTGFEAINPQGQPVHGVVCSGWFKGATVRFY